MRTKIKLSELISKMLKIEHSTGVKLEAYYLYDKTTKEKITIQNCNKSSDYSYIYNNCTKLDYSYDEELDIDPVKVLQRNKGFLYIPICLRNQQKAYIFQFNTDDLCRAFVQNNQKKRVSSVIYEQICLPLEEMGGVIYARA